MCIEPRSRPRGLSLLELTVTLAVFSLVGLAISSLFLFSIRSLAALSNYTALDQMNQRAVDRLTREIRHAKLVNDFHTNSLTIINGDSIPVTFTFNPRTRQLTRTAQGETTVLLDDCDLIHFNLNQRNPIGGSYDIYPVALDNWQQTAKVINLTWRTSRSLPNGVVNSENIQTARIVIRKK